MLTIPWTIWNPRSPISKEFEEMLVVSYLVLHACISFSSVSEKSGAFLLCLVGIHAVAYLFPSMQSVHHDSTLSSARCVRSDGP